MNPKHPERRQDLAHAVLLIAIIVLAIALRFLRLGDWSFDSDEVFMLRDSLNPRLTNARPLGYLLNHYLVLPFRPLDEFGIRLLPAIFGALTVPVFYLVIRRLIGARPALLGALLLAVSPLHVIYSQFGRYWSLVFLLCVVYPYAIYIGVREGNRRALTLGIICGILAALAHPASVLLLGGPAIWLSVAYLRPRHLKVLWREKALRWGILAAALVTTAIVLRFIPLLQSWITQHDQNPGSGEFLLRPPTPPGVKQLLYLVGYVEGWTLPLVLTAAVGILILWQGRNPILARFLVSLAVFPMIFLPLVSLRTPISAYYLMTVAPVFFIGAAVFLDRLFDIDWKLNPRWLLPATVVAMMIAAGAPTLTSQYRNGRRYDIRGAARWLEPRLTPADIVYSDQRAAMAHYVPQNEVRPLRHNTRPLTEAKHALTQSEAGAALWVVAPAPSHAFRTTLRQGGLANWLFENCRLRNVVGVGRMDFRHQYLQIYRCPSPAPSLTLGADSPGATVRPFRDKTSR